VPNRRRVIGPLNTVPAVKCAEIVAVEMLSNADSGASARKRSYQAPESGLMVQGPNYQPAMSVSICVGVPACLGAYPNPVP
jgi:hypothetical protein